MEKGDQLDGEQHENPLPKRAPSAPSVPSTPLPSPQMHTWQHPPTTVAGLLTLCPPLFFQTDIANSSGVGMSTRGLGCWASNAARALCNVLTAERGIPAQLSKIAPQLSAPLGFHPFTAWGNKEGERRWKRLRCPNECTCCCYHGFIDSIPGLTEKFKDNASIMLMCSSVVSIISIVRLPEQIPFQWWIG